MEETNTGHLHTNRAKLASLEEEGNGFHTFEIFEV
jgi:hypothetical protein